IAPFHALSFFLDSLKENYQFIYLPCCTQEDAVQGLYSEVDIDLINMYDIDLSFTPDIMCRDDSFKFYQYKTPNRKSSGSLKVKGRDALKFLSKTVRKSRESYFTTNLAETVNHLFRWKHRKKALILGTTIEYREIIKKLKIASVLIGPKRNVSHQNDNSKLEQVKAIYSQVLSPYAKHYREHLCKSITTWCQMWIPSNQEMQEAEYRIQNEIDIVLDGVGANNIWDAWLTYCANKHYKPVICFQHGGGNGLFENPFREYMDYNPLFKRTNVLFGENSTCGHENNITEKRIAGSVVLKKSHEKSQNVLPEDMVLYIPTHKQEENRFKDYSFNSGSDEQFMWDRALIQWAKSQDIKMVIKVHPVSRYEWKYYRLLVRECDAANVEVTQWNSSTELILQSSLIIVNTLSMTIAQALSANRQVMLIKPKELSGVNW
ncbi:MAG: hypothetical protein ACE5H1_09555, partial [Thermodesulfobacteriota bacterium]